MAKKFPPSIKIALGLGRKVLNCLPGELFSTETEKFLTIKKKLKESKSTFSPAIRSFGYSCKLDRIYNLFKSVSQHFEHLLYQCHHMPFALSSYMYIFYGRLIYLKLAIMWAMNEIHL